MKKTLITSLVLMIMAGTSLAQTPPPSPRPDTKSPAASEKSQLFQVVLVVGSTAGTESVQDLPKNAAKAIDDIRDFLPYKNYKLLDAGLLRAVADSMSSEMILKGKTTDGDREFRATLRYRERKDGQTLLVDQFILFAKPEHMGLLKEGYAPEAPSKLIDTSFSIGLNETIVVGSSRLNGSGTAIIVLLTALPMS